MPMNMVEARSHEEEDVVKARVEALVQLGRVMGHIGRGEAWPGHASGLSGPEYMELDRHVREAGIANGWATEENVRYAFSAWAQALGAEEVGRWVSAYPDLQRARGMHVAQKGSTDFSRLPSHRLTLSSQPLSGESK